MEQHRQIVDPRHFLRLYGTTPPRAGTPEEKIARAAERLAERLRALTLDGIVIYDVQEEQGRTSMPRPFPFLPTSDSRAYSRRLHELTGLTPITYKCIADVTEECWNPWLDETAHDFGIDHLSLVGLPTSRGISSAVPLPRAMELAAAHPAGFTLGGVAIAERHTARRSESERLRRKAEAGCDYFISQAVYSPEPTIRLLSDYARECAEYGVTPRRIVLTFVPCGRERTLTFLRWLGIEIAAATAATIMDDPTPLTRSIAICREHLRAILDHDYIRTLPLGLNVESVSIFKDEIEGSVVLTHALQEIAREYGLL